MVQACRRELRSRLAAESAVRKPLARRLAGWAARWLPSPAVYRPAAALALLAVGFFSAEWMNRRAGRFTADDPAVAARVRYLTPGDGGDVRIVLEETRQRVLSGSLNDESIRRMLFAAARDSSDPGLRAQSVEVLTRQTSQEDVRQALLHALEHDANAAVRLKALQALKPFARDIETRRTLARVLLADDNLAVRTQAIDLLVGGSLEVDTIGALQELMRKENNPYVRERSMEALKARNASLETF
jgi:hypothetical protein